MFEKEVKIIEMRQKGIQIEEGAQRERCRNRVSCVRERERKRKGNVGIRKERLEREGGIEDRGACFASRNTVQEKQDLITVKELILGEESCSKRDVQRTWMRRGYCCRRPTTASDEPVLLWKQTAVH